MLIKEFGIVFIPAILLLFPVEELLADKLEQKNLLLLNMRMLFTKTLSTRIQLKNVMKRLPITKNNRMIWKMRLNPWRIR